VGNFEEDVLRAFRASERGATAVEFAFVAPMAIALLCATVEVGALEVISTNLDTAVMATTRQIRTGASERPTSNSDFVDAVCANMVDSLATCRSRLTTSVKTFASFAVAAADTAAPAGQFNAGGSGDIVVVKAVYRWPLILPMYAANFRLAGPTEAQLSTSTTFRNEPYD
jgi:Flp pilus assembly protein TadG